MTFSALNMKSKSNKAMNSFPKFLTTGDIRARVVAGVSFFQLAILVFLESHSYVSRIWFQLNLKSAPTIEQILSLVFLGAASALVSFAWQSALSTVWRLVTIFITAAVGLALYGTDWCYFLVGACILGCSTAIDWPASLRKS